jgi:hypothetical protein
MEESERNTTVTPLTEGRIRTAIEDGEVIYVIYNKGTQPNRKRPIAPISIRGPIFYARDITAGRVKSFCFCYALECDETHPAENYTSRSRSVPIGDPVTHFEHWAFCIKKAHWAALGVAQREFVDRDKTKAAKKAAKSAGYDEEYVKRIAHRYLSYSDAGVERSEFHEGDLFHHKTEPRALQIAKMGDFIEVHEIHLEEPKERHAYRVTADELASWLKDGNRPSIARITPSESGTTALLRYLS